MLKGKSIHFFTFVLLVSLLITGCTSSPPTADSSGENSNAAAADATAVPAADPSGPVRGGTLRVAQAREPDSMDPDKSASRYNEYIMAQIYDSLVTIDENGQVQPWLATSWEVSDDGLTWTFELRDDVTFHDGTPFNAEAVKFNFDRVVDPATKSVGTIGQIGSYTGSKVIDEYTIEVYFEEPFAPFLSVLSETLFGMKSPTAVKEYGEDYVRNPVGSGPYIFVEWAPKDHVTLRRNPDYNWAPPTMDHQGPGYLDEIVYTFPEEPSTRVALLETGEVDLITHVPFGEVERLEEDLNFYPRVSVIQSSAGGLLVNTEKPPTDDIQVRQALQYATNQDELSQVLTFGVEPPTHGVFTPESWVYYNEEAELYDYDPDQARKLLEEADWIDADGDGIREKEGAKLSLVYICFPGPSCRQAELIQAQYREVGADVEIMQLNNPANKEASTAGKHNLRPMAWKHVDPVVLNIIYHPDNVDAGWSFSRWREPELAQMLEDAEGIFDQEKRAQKYHEIQMYIMENALHIPTKATALVLGVSKNIHNVKTDPTGYAMVFYDTWIEQE